MTGGHNSVFERQMFELKRREQWVRFSRAHVLSLLVATPYPAVSGLFQKNCRMEILHLKGSF